MRVPSLVGLFLLGVCIPGLAFADDVRVPLDREGRVESLSGSRAREIGVLTEHLDLEEARLYQDEQAGTFTLEVTQRSEGRPVRRRLSLTAEQVEALRQQVSAKLASALSPPPPPPSVEPVAAQTQAGSQQEGRGVFLATSTLVGLGFYSWAIPVGLRLLGGEAIGTGMLVAGVSFFLPFWLSQHMDVSWGMANMFSAGVSRGALDGILLAMASIPSDFSGILLAGVGASLVGGIASAFWAHQTRMSPGTAHAILVGHDMGMVYATAVYLLAMRSFMHTQGLPGFLVVGGLAGTMGGAVLSAHRHYTWGEAEVIKIAGILGGYLTVPILAWAPVKDSWLTAGLVMAGLSAGLVGGDLLLHGKGISPVQGILIELGTLAGAAVGLGVAANVQGDPQTIFTLSALGAAGGFAAAYALQAPGFASARASASAKAEPSIHVRVDPFALVVVRPERGAVMPPPPLVAVEGAF